METNVKDGSKPERVLMLDRKYNVAVIGEPTDYVPGKRRLLANATYIHRVEYVIPAIGKGGGYIMMSAIQSIVAVAYGIDDLWERWN
jgi:hypothetical protein